MGLRRIAQIFVLSLLGWSVWCPAAAFGSTALGALTQLSGTAGCISFDGSGGTCVKGRGIDAPESLAITHDGKFAYGSSYGAGSGEEALSAYRVLPGGALAQLVGTAGCFTDDGRQDGLAAICTVGRTIGTGDGTSIAVSPDDRYVYAVSTATPTGVAVFRRNRTTGALTQLAGTSGCVNPAGAVSGGCAVGRLLTGADGIVMSPDPQARFVYVASYTGPHVGLAVFARNPSTGALTQLAGTAGCLSNDGQSEVTAQPCTKVRGIDAFSSPEDPVISSDGRNLYFSAYHKFGDSTTSGTIAFSRNPGTGVLTQLPGAAGCFTSTGLGPDGASCTKARGLRGAYEEAISPDGGNLYVGAYDARALVVFKRQSNGALVQLPGKLGCISADGGSQDGPNTCTVGRAVSFIETPAVSPDGRTVYTSGFEPEGAVGVFSRDPSSGALTQFPGLAGCFSLDGSSESGLNTCTVARGLGYTYGVVVSPDGGNVYATGETVTDGGFATFRRQTTPVCTSALVAVNQATPTKLSLTCRDPNASPFTRAVLAGPVHGRISALTSSGTVLYTPRTSYVGLDRIIFRASDATGPGTPAEILINVVRDKTKPRCSGIGLARGRVARFLRRGLPMHLSCSEAVRLRVTLSIGRHLARSVGIARARLIKIASGKAALGSRGTAKLRLSFTRGARRALARSKPRKLGVTVTVVAIDLAGNRSIKRVHLTLK